MQCHPMYTDLLKMTISELGQKLMVNVTHVLSELQLWRRHSVLTYLQLS